MTLTLTIRNTDAVQPGMRRELVLSRRGGTIGRANVNNLWLPDQRKIISSDHCEVEYADGVYFLHDISLNGTYLNKERTRMSAPRRIEPGDEFRIGHYIIVANLSGESELLYEQEQEHRRADSSDQEIWGAHEADRQGGPVDEWDGDEDSLPGSGEPAAEPLVDDDVWDPVPAADRPSLRANHKRSIWDEEEEENRNPSHHSSKGPDFAPDLSADDIWGRIENDQRIDLDRARIGLEIEEERDPFSDFYLDDPESALFDEPRRPPLSATDSGALPRRGAGSDRHERGLTGERSAPIYDDDTWDDPDEGDAIEETFEPPTRRHAPLDGAPRQPVPRRLHEGARPSARGAPQSQRHPESRAPQRDQVRAREPHSKAELEHLARAFLVAAGIDPRTVKNWSPAMIDKSGQMFGKLVAGLFVLLEARSRAKAELGAQKTSFPVSGNNPLKFALTPEEALAALINPPARGFMNAGQAIDEAFFDLQAHQEATVMAMRGALHASLDKFSPKAIRKTVGEKGFLKKVLPGAEEAELWRAYERAFSGVVRNSDEAFLDVFAREFKAAYEKAGRR